MTAVARPGLQPLKIQQNNKDNTSKAGSTPTTLKASVSQSLANAQRATGGVSYGIMAQRTAVGSGAIFNVKQFNSNSIAMQRYQLNANRVRVNNNIVAPKAHNCSGSSNKFNDALVAMQLLNKTLGSLAAAKTDKSSDTKQPDGGGGIKNSAVTTTSSSSTKSLGEMKNASNSTELDAALTKARADKDAIPEKIASANSELSTLKGQTEKLKSDVSSSQENYDKKQKDVSEKSNVLSQKEGTEKARQIDVDKAGLEFDKAEQGYRQATANVSSLEALLSRMKPDDPNYAATAKDLADAKTELAKADQKLKVANQAKSDAQKALDKAKEETKAAKEALETSKKELEEAKQVKKQAEEDLNKNIKEIDTKQAEVKQLEADKKELETEIPKQQTRLTNLQKKENNELTKIDGKISTLSNKASNLLKGINVNDEDGLSTKDKKNKAEADKLNTEADKLKERKAELEKRKAIKYLPSETIGNTQFKSGTVAGKEVYIVDGKEVSKDEFNRKKTELQSQQS